MDDKNTITLNEYYKLLEEAKTSKERKEIEENYRIVYPRPIRLDIEYGVKI